MYGQLWREFKDRNLEAEFRDGRCVAASDLPFTSDEEQLLKAVFDSFGQYSGIALSRMTHAEEPWLLVRERAGVDEGVSCRDCREPIRLSDLKSFFCETAHRSGMGDVNDIKRYAKSAFSTACS